MVDAIILAAGLSKRMGKQNKLLLPVNGKSLIEHTVDTVLKSEIHNTIVVTGYESSKIIDVLANRKVKIVHNEFFKKGITSSIKAGVNACDPHTRGIMICLSDMPFINYKNLNTLLSDFLKEKEIDNQTIKVPVINEQHGNPVIFSSFYKKIILSNPYTEGCKAIVTKYREHVKYTKFNNPKTFYDIDTKGDYERYCNYSVTPTNYE